MQHRRLFVLRDARPIVVGKRQDTAMSESRKNENNGKAPYQRPQVVRVSLRPEEAVLGHCKVTGSAGPAGAGCRSVVVCRSLGS
jgi:hypothetical protein